MTTAIDFTLKFQEVSGILAPYEIAHPAIGDDELVALKLRPVEAETGPSNCYVYPAEYEEIYSYLTATFGDAVVVRTPVHHRYGFASVYRLQSGEHFVFVEHETGPELFAYLHTIRDVLTAVTGDVIALGAFLAAVNKVARVIRNSIADHNRKPTRRRHYGARAIKVARRTSTDERPIRSIEVESESGEAVEALDEVG